MLTLLILIIFLLLPLSAIGDIVPNPVSASNLRPLEPTSVRMVSEVVTVDLYNDGSTVEVLFEMKNLGEMETVEVGFPIMDFYFGWKTSLFVGQNLEGDRFKVWVDDQPVEDIKIYGFNFREVSSQEKSIAHKKQDILREGSLQFVQEESITHNKQDILREDTFLSVKRTQEMNRQPGFIKFSAEKGNWDVMPWYIWNTTFPKGETRWIKVRYSLPRGTNKRNNFFNYVLHTGANWNETIGKATIKVNIYDIPDEDILHITPSGYTKEGNVISWTFTDFEPTLKEDIFVYYKKEYIELPRESADVYLDNKKADINLINPENITFFRVERADTLNFPASAIFIHTKEFDFTLLKELVRKASPGNFKELAELEVSEFYSNYEVRITGGETKKGESFHDLSVVDIAKIVIDHNGDKNQLIITKK